jgi:hypothetical protein
LYIPAVVVGGGLRERMDAKRKTADFSSLNRFIIIFSVLKRALSMKKYEHRETNFNFIADPKCYLSML